MKRFNDWLADKLSYGLSTMACFYVVALGTLSTLYFDTPNSIQGWVIFWVGIFFPSAALPILGYVGRKSGEKQEKVINETHDLVMEELVLLREQLNLIQQDHEHVRNLLYLAMDERERLFKRINEMEEKLLKK